MISFGKFFVLNEGGAAGHMQFVYEDMGLPFSTMLNMFKGLMQGEIKAIEKVDGQNIFFTWNEQQGQTMFARNTGDVKSGGMNLMQLRQKFAGRGAVEFAFADGGTVINSALQSLDDNVRSKLFGEDGDTWVNAEIMHSSNPNVIQYSGNYIVMHSMTRFTKGQEPLLLQANFNQLVALMDSKTEKQNEKVWEWAGPKITQLINYDEQGYGEFEQGIAQLCAKYSIDINTSTIGDFVYATIKQKLKDVVSMAASIDIALCVAEKSEDNAVSLKKKHKEYAGIVSDFCTSDSKLKRQSQAVEPIKDLVFELSFKVLQGVSSFFVKDQSTEIKRLHKELEKTIAAVEQAQDAHREQRMQILQSNMKRLQAISNVASALEGVVFSSPDAPGKLFKITGAFAPANQILGMRRYRRGSIPSLAEIGFDV